ncbi:dTDP-4-dehydrorhamnose 3,5-epimerase [Comamonas sp.]|uniref:dTDP-4-dehydrorhamnose 3,5-epimerase n=1 Tax=Comamonas sp. TaxID=34028 RepID=UPI002588E024|nr:dTDP-4-dehydrorhamnose 3,5-epimerase [Comamonas sp.]
MKVTRTVIADVMVIEPKVFGDARGFFVESFNQKIFNEMTGTQFDFVQDNHSRSSKGVLRGLHYQLPPHAQGKLVRVTRGAVWDVAVDMRQGSSTFGQWVAETLTENNHKQFWIPPGFAHGFVVLSDTADFLYKTTAYYAPQSDRGIAWNDADIGIQWPDLGVDFLLSDKDQKQPAFKDAQVFAA